MPHTYAVPQTPTRIFPLTSQTVVAGQINDTGAAGSKPRLIDDPVMRTRLCEVVSSMYKYISYYSGDLARVLVGVVGHTSGTGGGGGRWISLIVADIPWFRVEEERFYFQPA